ncbi:MAG TPA: TolC family protein [Terracidiphilus sp.]|nr:TolC family protein [Terracidiphilus sp.]
MQIKFANVLGCSALVFFLSSIPTFSQQTGPDSPHRTSGSPQQNTHSTGKPDSTQETPVDNRPITEPTIPPVDGGEAMHMHMHHINHVMPQLPVIGRSKAPDKGPVYQLTDLEQRALAHNPTLAEAQRNIEAAQGIRTQVGLGPNPTVGYYGDEIRGGSYRSGKQGFFIDQPVITGGKLGLNRKIEDQSIHQMEASSEAQRYRVLNATREAYYEVLTAQELLNIKHDLANIAHSTSEYTRELSNTGQADETEVLQTEVAEQRMSIAVGVQENRLHRSWAALASAVGEPALPIGAVAGDIESLPPDADDDKLLDKLLAESPAVRYAQAGVDKAEAELKRARRDPVPDITARGGIAQDNEPVDTPQSRTGLVGFAEIGLQLHLFDHNQGTIDADRAGIERAREELTRIELSLRDRSAAVTDDYRNARLIAVRYHDEILPRIQRAYVLITTQYGLMDASFSRVLNLQKELYSAEVEYLNALEDAQMSHVTLEGFLYSGGLDVPSDADPSMGGATSNRPGSGRMPQTMAPMDLNSPDAQSSIFDSGLQP